MRLDGSIRNIICAVTCSCAYLLNSNTANSEQSLEFDRDPLTFSRFISTKSIALGSTGRFPRSLGDEIGSSPPS
jgi:hypothetical protein